ncbi:MAG: hypothetical protein JXR94_08450 [Candidatus Hydrogenedentes bacterium]|nr:hypothetical protein [Candidatus Hydrogenedentota bacterium]
MHTGIPRAWFVFAAVCAMAPAALAAAGAVVAEPASVTFESPEQTIRVRLTAGGEPVAAGDIGACKLFAGPHDYDEMFSYAKEDGAVVLTPTKFVEVGSYRLVIDAAAGEAQVAVYTPLSDLPTLLEKRAAAEGVTMAELKKRLGFVVEGVRSVITIQLPAVYYEGQTLELVMPDVTPDRECIWAMNGEVMEEGLGKSAFSYTFPKPGEYALSYLEKRDGVTVAAASAYTTVAALPAVPYACAAGAEAAFQAPAGYGSYAWRIAGVRVGTGPVLKHEFPTPGTYAVECRAAMPEGGPADGFARFVYEVTVSAR